MRLAVGQEEKAGDLHVEPRRQLHSVGCGSISLILLLAVLFGEGGEEARRLAAAGHDLRLNSNSAQIRQREVGSNRDQLLRDEDRQRIEEAAGGASEPASHRQLAKLYGAAAPASNCLRARPALLRGQVFVQ